MARPLRIEYPGAWYHVTCRGNEKRNIFRDDADRDKLLEILSANLKLYRIELHSYVLMQNHFHIILMTPEANLGKFMQRFNTTYTVYFNRRHRRSGHLFQGRYKAILIEKDEYLVGLSRYIHLNPVRIKKYSQLEIEEKRKILKGYAWSSYAGYTHLRKRQPFAHYSEILDMAGGGDSFGGRKKYEQFVMDGIMKDMNITFWKGVRGQTVLGSDDFVDWIYESFLSKKNEDRRELSGIRDLQTDPGTVEEIGRAVAREFGVEEEGLYRPRGVPQARSILMELCRVHLSRKMNFAEIGRRLGGISVSAISQNKKRLEASLRKDSRLRESLQRLSKGLD
ncbi:transposase [Patescibacteria group bacterium]|nr:transposase [Patescibacteria group bacterium]